MDGVNSRLFSTSQWQDCKNTGAVDLPPYAVAEVVGMTTGNIEGRSRPLVSIQRASSNNPERIVFTGPLGIAAGKTGVCHAETFGYAAHDSSLSAGSRYGVNEDSTILDLKNGDFIGVGDTFTSGGNSVSLFYRRPADTAQKIFFTIVSVSGTSATVVVNYASCNASQVVGIDENCMVTVYDLLGCLLSQAEPSQWVGIKGAASRVQAINGVSCQPAGSCVWAIDALCCPPT